MPDIAKLADDPAWEVRNMVMQAAGKLRYVDFAPALSKALADPAWWVRFSAAQSLFLLGESGIRSLRDATTGATDRYASDMSRQVLEEHGIAINRISA
jgi:HEAT repeat protein